VTSGPGDQLRDPRAGRRSIGLSDAKRGSLCAELTDLIAEFCGIARDRIFLVMVDVNAKLWGHDGKTFG
jgi:phenylpyruvate tautomerase PptA (4-oxalocrotonate tautomerase family)